MITHKLSTGFAGPRIERPDLRVHELIARRAAEHPDRVAAEDSVRAWTYGELDGRANRLAHALLDRGLGREDIVAVVTERHLDWMAAVLGVLKAGGVYLPVEPHFPAARVADMLDRSGCRVVLTEPDSDAELRAATASLPGVEVLPLGTAYDVLSREDDPGVEVPEDQAAYLFFTSGSTGRPKGALCEHAGFLNHVLAKVEDLGIGVGDVVAQTAPQCFDISLWQLLAGPVAGGRTVVLHQQTVLDVPRFVDAVEQRRVAVLQVVPSYLDAVLTYLDRRPRSLPDLRCVSVTGEALPATLARRWFSIIPGVPLVNAYGLTETCDDTNHEVLIGPPDDDRVPLGRPIANVEVRVVDDRLQPVPIGDAGEIVAAGVCVGRGYVGDPERTRRAFVVDPEQPGGRLYRTGDLGRWRPDGRLEFLGRRDAQVKVSGFRVEPGDIEAALVRVPGVTQAAVVVAGDPARARLVACCTGSEPVPPDDLRAGLAATLPDYLVPAAYLWLDRMPLTGNGKIDRAALGRFADARPHGQPDGADTAFEPPDSDAERRLAAAWALVLDVPVDRIGRTAHFFDLGGTSLTAVRLAVALDRALTPADVRRHSVLSDLAHRLAEEPS